MARCKHENAREASRLDSWLWCPDCRKFLQRREVEVYRFAAERH